MSSRSQAQRVARAATRYRPGRAPVNSGETYSSDESDQGDIEPEKHDEDGVEESISDLSHGTKGLFGSSRKTAGVILQDTESKVSKPVVKIRQNPVIEAADERQEKDEEGSSEYETDTDEEISNLRGAHHELEKRHARSVEHDSSSEAEDESEEDEEESDSDEDPPKPMFKPMFKSKSERVKEGEAAKGEEQGDAHETIMRQQQEERRKQSHHLAAERIKREIAEKEAEDSKPDLDDTDGKDPEAEFSAWRIRELSRIQRERQAIATKEEERLEIERRRALPEEQRLAEDLARAEQSRSDKHKGDMGFLQKYYHKGSFFQDLDILSKRDYTQATESAIDKRLLPKVMQVRDYGKASRSKWTHLANEDTTKRQEDPRFKGMSGSTSTQGCFACGGPHLKKDCPREQERYHVQSHERDRRQNTHTQGREERYSRNQDHQRRKHRDRRTRSRSPPTRSARNDGASQYHSRY